MPAPDCQSELQKLYAAILALNTGEQVTSISFGERAVSYAPGQLPQLLALYRTFWRACGREAGYPDLSAGHDAERGPPATFRML